MVVLSYDNAKRSLIMLAVYLVGASLVFKGIGHLLEINFVSLFESVLNGTDIGFKLPEFSLDSFSFDLLSVTLKEKFVELIQTVLPVSLGVIDYSILGSINMKSAIGVGARKAVFKA